MNYVTLLLKKNAKRFLNILPVILVLSFISLLYYGNSNSLKFETNHVKENIAITKDLVEDYQIILKRFKPDTEIYNDYLLFLKDGEERLELLETRLTAITKKDAQTYYSVSEKLEKRDYDDMSKNLTYEDPDSLAYSKLSLEYYRYMQDHDFAIDDRWSGIQGFSFMAFIIDNYMPIMLAILLIFFLSNLYCASNIDRMDIHKLLPMSRGKRQLSRLLSSLIIGIATLLGLSLFCILLGGIFHAFGNFEIPILTYTLEGASSLVSFASLLLPFLVLTILSILLIINIIAFFSTFLKRNIVCLLFSLAVILGGMWVTTNIVPLAKITHILPTTYFDALEVISGEMMFTLGNANINFINGVIVLTISNLVLMAAYYFFSDFSWKKKKKEKVMVVSNDSKETYHNDKATKATWGYIKFTSKRVLCRKSNIVMILLTVVVAVVFLLMNMGNQSKLEETIKGQIINNEKYIQEVQKEQSEYKKGSAEYINYGNLIKDSKNDNEDYKKVLSSIEKEDWETVYTLYPKILEKQITDLKHNESENIDGIQFFQQQIAYFEYLQEHDLAYENIDFPIYGLSFTTSLTKIILPIILTICCIYLLAQFFTLDYVKGLDISVLYPLQSKKTFLTKLMLGIVFTVVMYSVLLLSILLITTLFTGNAGLQQPFMLQNSEGVWQAVSMISMFKKWFFLGVLFTINLSIFVYILSFLIREDMFVLITALLVILGFVYLPKLVRGIAQYAHLFPTTYMDSVNVADGFLAQQYGNTSISISTGISVLLVSIVVQFIICIVLNNAYELRKIRKR